ncbi:hypothetical protein AAFD07_001660 [Enterococcus faecalis]
MGEAKVTKTFRLTELVASDLSCKDLFDELIAVLEILDVEVVNKKIVYFYKRNVKSKQEKLEVCFTRESILHLIGISYYDINERETSKSRMKSKYAIEFYRDFKRNKLNFSKCWVESIRKVKDKLQVLKYIKSIKTDVVRIGADGQLRTIPITNTISTPKIGLGIGLYHDHPEFSIPRSCLNLAQDKEAKQHTSFRNACRCTKIWIYERTEQGTWKLEDRQEFFKKIQAEKSKKKRKKK